MKRWRIVAGVRVDEELARRRKRAGALRSRGLTTRQIAGELGVSQPTVVRDLRAIRDAEAEAVLAALLRGRSAARKRKPKPVTCKTRAEHQRNRWKRHRRYDDGTRGLEVNWQRRHRARALRDFGYSYRQIAEQLGISAATVMRDLRRKGW